MDQEEKLNAAGFGVRLVAHLIDSVIITAIVVPFAIVAIFKIYGLDHLIATGGKVAYPWWIDAAFYVVVLGVVVVLWKVVQATPGKKAMGLRVVDARTGGPAATWRLTVRSLGYLISAMPVIPVPTPGSGWGWSPIPLMFGCFWILLSKKNYAWHDSLSGAIVVSSKELAQTPPPLPTAAAGRDHQ